MKKLIVILFAAIISNEIKAQAIDFDSEAISADFVYNINIYSDALISPIMGNYSASQVAANHVTAKTLKPFAVSIGFSGSGTVIEDDELKFNFNKKGFSDKMTLSNPTKPILPSIMGGNTTAEFVYEVEDKTGLFGFEQKIAVLDGITSPGNAFPAGAINLSVGLPMKTEIFIRALPKLDLDGLETYLIGGGVKHMISQYLQKDDEDHNLNVAIAGFVGKSKFTIVPEDFLEGENQAFTFTDNTFSTELIASYDRKYWSIFGQIGYYSGVSEFAMEGTYRYEVSQAGLIQEVFETTDPINLKKEVNGLQTQIGASVNFSTMGALALSYSMAKSNTIAFNLRFYINNGE